MSKYEIAVAKWFVYLSNYVAICCDSSAEKKTIFSFVSQFGISSQNVETYFDLSLLPIGWSDQDCQGTDLRTTEEIKIKWYEFLTLNVPVGLEYC